MELRHLRYFLAVAQEKHFRRAAETLFISQPGLSQQIQELEKELGQPLFDRAGKRVELTAAGLIFRDYAARSLREMDDAKTALAELAGMQRGHLVVGAVQTVNAQLVSDWVVAFSAAFPGVSLRIEEMSADEIEEGVLSGQLHIGVSFVPTTADGLEVEPLFTEDLVLICSEGHPLAGRTSLPVAHLHNEPMILLPGTYCTRRLLNQVMGAAGAIVHTHVEMTSIAGIIATVRRTGIATVLPRTAIASHPDLVAIPLTDPTPRRAVGILHRAGAFKCTACRAFAALIQQKMSELEPFK